MVLTILFSALICSPIGKSLRFEDWSYEEQIRTVRIFPNTEDPEGKTLPAVSSLNGRMLQLEFDDLQPDRNNYYVKILHCNYDWTPSRLHDLDFLKEYNEFNVNDYTYSANTLIPYVHYRFLLPQVKLPGNYLLIVYRDGDRDDLVLSRRFMISSNLATISRDSGLGMTTLRATNQQIQFTINYSGIDITNPIETVNAVIRQNQRWDNAQKDIKPSFVRENTKTLEYRFFNYEKSFQAGNEFRFVDFTSLNFPGQNTGRLEREQNSIRLFVAEDATRAGQRYAQFKDLDGNFIVYNRDGGGQGENTANYLNVVFTLQSPRQQSDVYVVGAFNDWRKNEVSKMTFANGNYTSEILLKQGFYNYGYIVDNDMNIVEGNYYETENFYEIFIYNHSLYPEADLLIGYAAFKVNPR